MSLNSLPNDKIPDWSIVEAFADDKLDVVKMVISLFDKSENTGKRRKCWLPAFSPFPTVFLKVIFLGGHEKSRLCGKGLS